MQLAARRALRVSLLIAAVTLLLVGIATYVVWRDVGRPVWGVDDAVIFFVYARNMAAGHGIVYSVGGPHVEGASSILYLLICWLAWVLFPQPPIALLIINGLLVALSFFLIWTVFQHIESALELPRASALIFFAAFLLWMFTNPPFFFWSTVSLLDTATFLAVLVAGFTILAHALLNGKLTSRAAVLLSIVIVLTVLARPEGMGWGLLDAASFFAIGYWPASTRTANLRLLLLPLGAFVISLGGLIGFREVYFGHALPTTYYAKVTNDHLATLRDGVRYARHLIHLYRPGLLVPFAVVCGCAIYMVTRRNRSRGLRLTLLMLLFTTAGFLVPVAEGGDHFNSSRLYQPSFPLFVMLPVIAALPLFRRQRIAVGIVSLASLWLLFACTTRSTWAAFRRENVVVTPTTPSSNATFPSSNRFETYIAREALVDGGRLREEFTPDLPTIGIIAAGGMAFAYNGTAYDLIGLNDERMARADRVKVGVKDHASFNSDVFYSMAPDIVLPGAVETADHINLRAIYDGEYSPASFLNLYFKGELSTPRFQSEYQFALLRSSLHPELSCYGYFRRDYLQGLLRSGRFQLTQELP